MKIYWTAYCITCQKEIYCGWPKESAIRPAVNHRGGRAYVNVPPGNSSCEIIIGCSLDDIGE
jgi:hypothetical protein